MESPPARSSSRRSQTGRRFVEDEKLRPVQEGAGHDEPPDQPPGEVDGAGVFAVVEGHEAHQLPGAPGGLARGDVEVAGEDHEILEDGEVRIEVVLLLADADPRLDGAGIPGDIEAEDLERPRRERGEAVNHPDCGGLSRPVGAQDPEALPGFDRKGDIIDGNDLPEGLAEMLRFNDRVHGVCSAAGFPFVRMISASGRQPTGFESASS